VLLTYDNRTSKQVDQEHGAREPAEGNQADGRQLRASAGERHPDGAARDPGEHPRAARRCARASAAAEHIQVLLMMQHTLEYGELWKGLLHTYITSRTFPFGVARDHFLPLATFLTNTFRFLHCHQIPYTRSPVSGTPDLALY
jgi:hypothetical protein